MAMFLNISVFEFVACSRLYFLDKLSINLLYRLNIVLVF